MCLVRTHHQFARACLCAQPAGALQGNIDQYVRTHAQNEHNSQLRKKLHGILPMSDAETERVCNSEKLLARVNMTADQVRANQALLKRLSGNSTRGATAGLSPSELQERRQKHVADNFSDLQALRFSAPRRTETAVQRSNMARNLSNMVSFIASGGNPAGPVGSPRIGIVANWCQSRKASNSAPWSKIWRGVGKFMVLLFCVEYNTRCAHVWGWGWGVVFF